jgi:hypothetical protein
VLAGYISDDLMGLARTPVILAIGDRPESLEDFLEGCHRNDEGMVVFHSKNGNRLLITEPYIEWIQ